MFFNPWNNKKTRIAQLIKAAEKHYINGYKVVSGDIASRLLVLSGTLPDPNKQTGIDYREYVFLGNRIGNNLIVKFEDEGNPHYHQFFNFHMKRPAELKEVLPMFRYVLICKGKFDEFINKQMVEAGGYYSCLQNHSSAESVLKALNQIIVEGK